LAFGRDEVSGELIILRSQINFVRTNQFRYICYTELEHRKSTTGPWKAGTVFL